MENEVDKLLKELSDIDGVRKVAVINNVEKKLLVELIWMKALLFWLEH